MNDCLNYCKFGKLEYGVTRICVQCPYSSENRVIFDCEHYVEDVEALKRDVKAQWEQDEDEFNNPEKYATSKPMTFWKSVKCVGFVNAFRYCVLGDDSWCR